MKGTAQALGVILITAISLQALAGPAQGDNGPRRPGERPREARIQLPNQWSLDPAGESRPLGILPLNMCLTRDGRFLAVLHCGAGEHEIMVFDTATRRVVSRTTQPNAYYGMVFSADETCLYVSGGDDEVIYEYPFSEGYLQKPRVLTLAPKDEKRVPCGLALSADGTTLVVAETWGNSVVYYSLPEGLIRDRVQFPAEHRPYDVKFQPGGKGLYYSFWGAAQVAADPSGDDIKRVKTGDHPNEMVMTHDGKRLFVANANSNTVTVIDTAADLVIETLNTAMYPDSLAGSTPNSVDVSPDDRRLYIANADNNNVAVFDISEPGKSRSLGLIPVGWYPTSVRVSPDHKMLYVANGKGMSSFANPQGMNPYMQGAGRRTIEQYSGRLLQGSLSFIPVPSEDELKTYTERVYACSPYRPDRQPVLEPPVGSPVPGKVGDPSPIKYCFYIIKENRTYDHILGDLEIGNGDADLCLFPEEYTPNHHALAREFVLLDNFYVESQVSADGHEWTMGAYATDFVQKTWPSSYSGHGLSYPAEGAWPTAFPPAGYLWDRCAEAGVSFRVYGEFVFHDDGIDKPGVTNIDLVRQNYDPGFVGWELSYPDVKRAERFIAQFNDFVADGTLPRLIIMRLPNDHTAGTRNGYPTPRAMVADNDLALGMVVEAISKSSVWKESAIFVVEDDAQNGSDHVDAHRTVAFVVSPYTRGRGHDGTFYSTASMLRTMELILGLQPMSQYDAGAKPMYNAFLSKTDATPYACRPVSEAMRTRMNSPEAWGAELSARLDFEKEDSADDILFNQIIWKAVRGADSPMPAPVRAAFIHPVPENEGPTE